MRIEEVVGVLAGLEEAEVRYWVSGGWGIATLAGCQTREHRDLDLLVDAECLEVCLRVLEGLGYQRETDWLPVRVECAADDVGWVDVHPVRFSSDGHGRQEGLDGNDFDYPPAVWSVGTLEGRAVPCISVEQQRALHSGYTLRAQDVHDLEVLRQLEA